MKFTTAITDIQGDKEFIRGHSLEDLTRHNTFVETIFLLICGKLPNEKETRMLNALFTAAIDHGPGTPSALAARIVVAAKNSLHTAVASGLLAMGERHGSAIEGAGKFFQEQKNTPNMVAVLTDMKTKKIRVPGYGHALLTHDYRADTLFAIAKEVDLYHAHCVFAEAVGQQLNQISSKSLPVNVDGAMAAILSDMGVPWPLMKGFFIIARVPGLVAQVCEEIVQDNGIRRLSDDEVEYVM